MAEPVSLIPAEPAAVEAGGEASESNGNPVVTWALIGINVLLFISPAIADVHWLWKPTAQQLLGWGANFGPLTLHGQWWRLVTCCFLHLGVIHIAMNMFILLQAGSFAEALFGRVRYLALYLLAGIGGSLASAFRQPPIVSVGASGAIFGVYGAILGFLLMQRREVNPEAAGKIAKGAGIFLFYNLAYSLANPTVDLSAHLGGLAAGFLVGVPLARPLTPGRQKSFPLRTALVLGASAAAVAAVLGLTSKSISPRDELTREIIAGNSIAVAKNDKLIYSGSATAADAQTLAKALEPTGYFRGKGTALLLRKAADGTTISVITNDKDPARPGDGSSPRPDAGPHLVPNAWDDPAFLLVARRIGSIAASALGGPPVNVAVLTRDGVVERVLRVDERNARIGARDEVWYSGGATQADAEALGNALKRIGFFRDAGGVALLSRQGGAVDVSLMVKDGAWENPRVLPVFQAWGKQLSHSFDAPVRMHLVDRTLAVKKDL
jgi:rhomboid protease GluP